MRRDVQDAARLRRPDEFQNPQEYLDWQREWLREEAVRTNPRWKRVSADVLRFMGYFPFYLLLCLIVVPFMEGWGMIEIVLEGSGFSRILKGALGMAAGTLSLAAVLGATVCVFRLAPGWSSMGLSLIGLWLYFGLKLRL
jgi:hypothetical protein